MVSLQEEDDDHCDEWKDKGYEELLKKKSQMIFYGPPGTGKTWTANKVAKCFTKTKLDGEEALRNAGIPHLILRTSWVFSSKGTNFLLKILDLACSQERLEVVSDQVGSPCFAGHLATATTQILSLATRQNLLDFFQSVKFKDIYDKQ